MTDTVKLNECIRESGLKMSFIAQKMGLSPYGFQLKRENVNAFKADEIEKLCDILHIESLEDRFAIFFAKDVEKSSTDEKE